MRRPLGSSLPALALVAALAAALTACDDSDSVAKDPTTEGTTASRPGEGASEEPAGSRLVDTITVTAAGGTVSEVGTPLTDDAAVQGFLAQFESDDLSQQVQDAVSGTEVPDGWELYAAVIAIGCDSPDRVDVGVEDDRVTITARQVPSPRPECFAPMTTVALVLVHR